MHISGTNLKYTFLKTFMREFMSDFIADMKCYVNVSLASSFLRFQYFPIDLAGDVTNMAAK